MIEYDPNKHYENAKSLYENKSEANLTYTCLELRLCIEAIIYRKLYSIKDKIPETVFESWQPDKALAMLLKFDSSVDQDLEISFSKPNEKGEPDEVWYSLGEQKMLPFKTIRKLYQTLGSYLHQKSPKSIIKQQRSSNDKRVKTIESLLKDLKLMLGGNLSLTFGHVANFECSECNSNILFSNEMIKNNIVCQSDNCTAIYKATKKSADEIGLVLITKEIICQSCCAKSNVSVGEIKDGYIFKCSCCLAKHHFRSTFEYAVMPS